MFNFGFFMKKNYLIILLRLNFIFCLFPLLTFAQPSDDKKGGICFRYDDNAPLDKLKQIEEVFNKYNYKYCFAVNLAALPDQNEYPDYLKKLDEHGFELMDHCPNHGTNAFWIDNSEISVYENQPGVHHFNSVGMVCLEYEEIDSKKYLFQGTAHISTDTVISETAGGFKDYNDNLFIYFPSLQKIGSPIVVKNKNPNNPDTIVMRSYWGEMMYVNKISKVEFCFIDNSSIQLTRNARSILAQESMRLFEKYHLSRPLSWIQPGGKTPHFSSLEIKNTYGDKFHYTSGASDGGLQCYNDARKDARFAMQWGDFSGCVSEVSKDKKLIADQMAKHYFLIGGSHLYEISIEWKKYLSRVDSILAWCSREHIPVKTYREWSNLLYDTPQNPYTNIFPPLNTDINGDGIPDGYDLVEGKLNKTDSPPQEKYSLSIDKKGTLCKINSLAGFEKGENEFFIWTKGAPGDFITLTIRFQESNQMLTFKIPATEKEWTKYSLNDLKDSKQKVNFPQQWSYLHLDFSCTDYKSGEVKIGGFKLNKKLDNPLYVISKPDTLIYTGDPFRYQVIAAKYNVNDKLNYELLNAPSWIRIDKAGLITDSSGVHEGTFTVQINVKDQSGNKAQQTFSIRFTKRLVPFVDMTAYRERILYIVIILACTLLIILGMYFFIHKPVIKELKSTQEKIDSLEKLIHDKFGDKP